MRTQHEFGGGTTPLMTLTAAVALGHGVGGNTLTETAPPWPGTRVTICASNFMTGAPGKEHGTNKPPPTGRVQDRSKGDTTCLTTSQNPYRWLPSWLSSAFATRKDSESE